jgi:hypothetical protein
VPYGNATTHPPCCWLHDIACHFPEPALILHTLNSRLQNGHFLLLLLTQTKAQQTLGSQHSSFLGIHITHKLTTTSTSTPVSATRRAVHQRGQIAKHLILPPSMYQKLKAMTESDLPLHMGPVSFRREICSRLLFTIAILPPETSQVPLVTTFQLGRLYISQTKLVTRACK